MDVARSEAVATLNRAGHPDLAVKAAAELPDPVDQEQLLRWAARHGVTRDSLIDRMGGSP